MALARVKTWIAGEILTAADLNNEFNNILNNPITLISPTTGVITFTTAQTFPFSQVVTSSAGVLSQASPSRVSGLIGTLSSQIGSFAANYHQMRSTNGIVSWVVAATSAYSVNLGTAGPAAGGRDQAGVFASTYVHWYAISTGVGSTAIAGLVSSNPPEAGPVAMPTSYIGWTYLGVSAYSSSSTTLNGPHRFQGSHAKYDTRVSVLSGGTSTTVGAVSTVTNLPRNAVMFILDGSATVGYNSAADATAVLELHNTTSGAVGSPSNAYPSALLGFGAGHTFGWSWTAVMPQTTAQNFGYAFNNGSTASITSNAASLNLTEYTMPNGDV